MSSASSNNSAQLLLLTGHLSGLDKKWLFSSVISLVSKQQKPASTTWISASKMSCYKMAIPPGAEQYRSGADAVWAFHQKARKKEWGFFLVILTQSQLEFGSAWEPVPDVHSSPSHTSSSAPTTCNKSEVVFTWDPYLWAEQSEIPDQRQSWNKQTFSIFCTSQLVKLLKLRWLALLQDVFSLLERKKACCRMQAKQPTWQPCQLALQREQQKFLHNKHHLLVVQMMLQW